MTAATRAAIVAAMRRLLFVLLALLPMAAAAQFLASFPTDSLDIESGGKRYHFTIELALTPEQQAQGLMFRRTLAADAGMLFPHESEQELLMWMKNTLIPLDMVFIRADGTISRIAERAVPQSLTTIASDGPAAAVLEINGGTAARLGLKPGDKVIYKAFKGL